MAIKNTILILLILLQVICTNSQEFPKEKSAEHLNINGTNIFMVPPAEFKLSENFKGFQNGNDPTSMIMVLEIPGPYAEVTKGFNKDMLQTKGMQLIRKDEVTISNSKGLLLEVIQSANGMEFSKYILTYGNEKSTTLINAVFLQENKILGQQMLKSLLTTYVDNNIAINPRNALKYTLDEQVGDLKFFSVMGNGMLFNRDLKTPTESEDKATLITDQSFAKTVIADKKLFCISRLKKYPDEYSVIVEKGINEFIIDDLHGYEVYANNDKNKNEEMYQVILFNKDGGYYLFVGTYLNNNEKALSDIQKVIRTFKRK